jgi:predicted ATPase/DNA-binding winged helix-turn-helix (wHTH) protein
MRKVYELGPFRLDTEARVLTHDGVSAALGARGVAVLAVLVSHAGEHVEKSAILDAAWPGLVVEEANLAVQISAIRRALAVVPRGEGWIETLARRGYRFVGPVNEIGARSIPPLLANRKRTNLSESLTSFVGRERELAEIKQTLTTTRLMTLTGIGGLGKTRLAQQSGAEMLDAYRDGVWFVDLAPLGDPALVPSALAHVLQVKETAGQPLLTALCNYLRRRQTLLILDNCEHVLDGCARMTEALLRDAAHVTVMATSREALHLGGERVFPLSPLPLPDPRADTKSIVCSDAVQLFIERIRQHRPRFALEAQRARVVAEICVRLDGIPLALELGAARVAVLPVEQILRLLTERFRLLTSGDRDLPRHQTLRAMLDWSYDLLDDTEKKLFARLSVFAGGWTLKAAGEVCSGPPITKDDLVYVLISLIEQSLVIAEEDGDRYRMLETVREYCREKLDVAQDRPLVSERHARYFRDRFVHAFEEWLQGSDLHWNAVYLAERDNVRAALDWAFSPQGDADIGISLTAYCGPAWLLWSLRSEGLARVELALRRSSSRTPQRIRARVWLWLGGLSQFSDSVKWVRALRRAVALHRRGGDAFGTGYSLMRLGSALARTGRLDLAQRALDAARPLLAQGAVPAAMAPYFHAAGFVRKLSGDLAGAREHYEKGLSIYRSAGLQGDATQLCGALADTNWALGELDAAATGFREVIATMRGSNGGTELVLGVNLTNLAGVLVERGDLEQALNAGREGLELRRAAGYAWGALDHFALRAALVGRLADAARLAGYVDAVFARKGVVHQANEARARARLDHLLADQLDANERAVLMGEGATMSEEDACRLALAS